MSTVIGGAMLPHAPQFFTMPETEDKANVEQVREVAAEIGEQAARAQARPLDHLLQRPCRAVLPQRLRRRSPCMSAARRPASSPAANSTGRSRARSASRSCASSTGRASIRRSPHRQDRLRHRHPAHPSRPHRSGAADLRQCLSAAAADHGALLCLRPGGRAHGDRARA